MSEEVKKLISRLSTFRPSDRTVLTKYFTTNDSTRGDAVAAVKEFVVVWEQADWLEAYSIERIGKWLAKYQAKHIVDEIAAWAHGNGSDAHRALARGIEVGQRERAEEYA
ncbi:hypothetical protein ACC717_03835 [Rhizobium ruizarguesonis]|uniref:Uncharacterized protein n=1 Tax=Rhizobium ruizarguesonis TaxID=2081791 RepID=A0AB38I4C4_9HYPH|nr:hypothetical protein [Rhizobium ruizarguesonis]TBB66209.1 hypothetical protein ELH42_08575 [Rhizobium ruizarguesonis]TBB70601.1 hypothetical protein ELH45_08625 [Rhizobium ruizarguesonis]TBC15631.1 hypothetical protein ELH40_12190 [Rhizobium ruizarguesonis]